MKGLFLLLLLMNFCAALWIYSQERKVDTDEIKLNIPKQGQQLVLLSERDAQESQPESPVQLSDSTPNDNADKPKSTAKKLDEQTQTPASVTANAEPEVEPETPESKPTQVIEVDWVCHTIGPFSSASKFRRARRLLERVDAETNKREREEQEPYGYRVYLPPLSSQEKAYALAKELGEQSVKDYFVITNPNDKVNGISLGLFSQKTGALKRIAQLRNLGYQAKIEVRYRDRTIYWLDYVAQKGRVSQDLLKEMGEGVDDMQHLSRDCDAETPAEA